MTRGSVLIVEDDAAIRGVLEAALGDEGLDVRTAATGRSAIDQLGQGCPNLVLVDMMLPDMSGTAVAEELDAQCHGAAAIIVVTADASAPAKAASVGAVAHVAKPFDVNRLVDLVLNHLPPS